jgi:hypothetical protein
MGNGRYSNGSTETTNERVTKKLGKVQKLSASHMDTLCYTYLKKKFPKSALLVTRYINLHNYTNYIVFLSWLVRLTKDKHPRR